MACERQRTQSIRRWLASALVVALVTTACGGSDGVATTAGGETTSSEVSSSTGLPVDLDFLGALASSGDEVTQTFDASGGEQVLVDGAKITVPSGALSDPTEITSISVQLALDEPLSGTVYRLSTVEDVTLGEPGYLLIEVRPG